MLQLCCGGIVLAGKANAIEPGQTLLCADPQITVLGLRNGPYGILRQAVVNLPDAHVIVWERVGNGVKPKRAAQEQGGYCKIPAASPTTKSFMPGPKHGVRRYV